MVKHYIPDTRDCAFGPPGIERTGIGKVNLAVDRLFGAAQNLFTRADFSQ
jgi:hypothetical protein